MADERQIIPASISNALGRSGFGGTLHRRGIHDIGDDSDSDLDFEIPNFSSTKKIQNETTSDVNVLPSLCGTLSSRSEHSSIPRVPSLLDITAEIVGKTYTCEVLENCIPPLDDALLKKVAFWAFPIDETKVKAYVQLSDLFRIWLRGKSMVEDNRVKEMLQVGFMATACIMKYFKEEESIVNDVHVSVTFERQRILSSTCSECKTDMWCVHVVAAVIYRMRYPERIRVYAPMTETLSTLSRDQLQKILQYTVYDDPAGILGKVFKHIDTVTDRKSNVNTMAGIPDPTFGGMEVTSSEWQMSLNAFQEHLNKNLLALTVSQLCDDMSKYYPASFDKVEKQNAYLNKFNHHVVELIRCGEFKGAAKVLIIIMENVIKQMAGQTIHNSMRHYFHDLCRFYAVVMVYIQDKDPQAWKLLSSLVDRLSRKLHFPETHKMKTSLWAELPPLAGCFPQLEEDTLLYEPVAACRIKPPSLSFYKLFDHQPTSVDCCQLDDICIALARLEGFVKFAQNTGNRHQSIVNLILHILNCLYRYAKKYSIVEDHIAQSVIDFVKRKECGVLVKPDCQLLEMCAHDRPHHCGVSSSTISTGKRKLSMASNSSTELKKIKTAHGKGRRGIGQSKGKLPARKPSEQSLPLTQGQLVYGITYCCYIIMNLERKVVSRLCPEELLMSYVTLALELGYLHTSASVNEISETEHKWLCYLEKTLSSYLQDNVTVKTQVVGTYIKAFRKVGLDFYDGVYPLVLLDTLCYKVSLSPDLREKWCSDVVDILATVLRKLPDNLHKYSMLSSSNTLQHFLDCKVKKCLSQNSIQGKIQSLISVFLSLIQQGNSYHEDLVTEILCQFKKLESVTALIDVEDVAFKLCGMKCSQKVLVALVEFALHTYRTSRVVPVPMHLLYSLCGKLGLSSLNLIPKDWLEFFTAKEIHYLIFLFEADIRQLNNPPKKVVDLIFQVISKCFQCPKEICDLLSFFRVGDANHRKAIQTVLKNKSSYHQDVLITLSKEIFEKEKAALAEGCDSDCLKLIEAALGQVKEFRPLSDSHIDFLCSVATCSGPADFPGNTAYQLIVSQFAKCCSHYPSMLVRMLKRLQEAGSQWLRQATEVSEALIPAYSKQFCSRLPNCSQSSYASLIRNMLGARDHCITYVENGARRFHEEVVLKVRHYHRNKKRLVNMLDKEFPAPD